MDKIFAIVRMCVDFLETIIETIINVKKAKEEKKWDDFAEEDYRDVEEWEEVNVFDDVVWLEEVVSDFKLCNVLPLFI